LEAGLNLRVVRPFAAESLPEQLVEDGLVVLGGNMSASDDDEYPWLHTTRKLLQQAVELSRPTLGICLGGQLLSQTFGGAVVTGNHGLETGVVEVRLRSEAEQDELFASMPDPFRAGTMHSDMIRELPHGAIWLGDSDIYPHQAFRLGDFAWGVQFHPEVTLPSYRQWTSSFGGRTPETLRRSHAGLSDFDRFEEGVTASGTALGRRFAEIIYERWQLGN
jgi:GMP synthase (glutamine-hydrolysing)